MSRVMESDSISRPATNAPKTTPQKHCISCPTCNRPWNNLFTIVHFPSRMQELGEAAEGHRRVQNQPNRWNVHAVLSGRTEYRVSLLESSLREGPWSPNNR
jgi:hypothetical protein